MLSINFIMNRVVIFFLVSCIFVFSAYTQTDSKYVGYIKEVQENFLDNQYSECLYILKNLEKDGYTNANMDYMIGLCYLNSIAEKSLSTNYLLKASKKTSPLYNETNPEEINAPAEAFLYLGDAYLMNNAITDARKSYMRYLNTSYISEEKRDVARARLKNCLFARLQLNNPIAIDLQNAGNQINTGIANSHACISADGRKMVFMRTMKFYDAIFFTIKTDTGWLEPINITTQVGSDGDYIPTSLSPDGTRLLLKSFTETYGYEIYESIYNGRRWTKLKRMDEPINSKYHETDANFAPDGKTIYLSSNRAGGFGGYDIYKANWNAESKLYTIENVGNTINSMGDEKGPVFLEQGKVIVFNTDDRIGMGGYDYYHSQLLDSNKWSEPLNVGYPINTTSDDIDLKFSSITPRQGVLSRNDPKGHSANDIFLFSCPVFSTLRLIPISGKIKINDTTLLQSSDLMVLVLDENEKDTVFVLNPNTDGSYFAELYPGKFNLVVNNKGKNELQQDFTISSNFSEEAYAIESIVGKPVYTKLIKSDSVDVCDLLFDFNQSKLNASEEKILIEIINKIKKYTVKSIYLTGYTDNVGSSEYNKALSLQRAENIKDIFVKEGFASGNILTDGKGSSLFIAKNCFPNGKDNPEGRYYNRRVEINIVIENNLCLIIKKNRIPENLKIR
jgi:outer membrane protein OmpA-like peptidoglycan-associated protein